MGWDDFGRDSSYRLLGRRPILAWIRAAIALAPHAGLVRGGVPAVTGLDRGECFGVVIIAGTSVE